MKHFKQTALAFLLLFLVSFALTSCGGTETADTPSETAGSVSSDETEILPEEEVIPPEECLSLPDGLDFKGSDCNFLVRQTLINSEYYVESTTGEIVDDALYERNLAVEERLNVKLKFIPYPGEYGENPSINNAIRDSVMANDGAYDLSGVLSNQLSGLALEGLLTNLNSLPHLDFSKTWWAKGLLDELTVYNKLYFASGDASLGFLGGMMCVFCNKNLAESFDLPDLYETAKNGEWTIDRIVELTGDAYVDLDGDGRKSKGDRLGFTLGSWNQLYGFIDSFDLPMIERDADGVPSKFVYGDEKVVDAVAKLVGLFKSDNAFSVDNGFDYSSIFGQGNILFCTGEFHDTDLYRDIDNFDFGVIPMPKWNEEQTNYYTCVRATYSGFCIPVSAPNTELSAAVLEAFAYESWKDVSPIYFEKALKIKYARDNETAQMFDLIKSSATFKFGSAFTLSLGDPQNFFKGEVAALKENWTSSYAGKEKSFNKNLETTLETLKELP